MTAPIPYTTGVERIPADEIETTRSLDATLRKISETTFQHGGTPLRGVHAKSHALLRGELEVLSGLPDHLAQGMFGQPARYPAILRFSTIPGDLLHDSVSTPRGVALKVFDVGGARLDGAEEQDTQDFLLVNGPAFNAPDPKSFAKNLKLIALTTDRAEGAKKALSGVMRVVQSAILKITGKPSALAGTLGGQPRTQILGETYFSQTAFRYGDFVAKFRLQPESEALRQLIDAPLQDAGDRDAIRKNTISFFAGQHAVWNVQVQLRTNDSTMPVEDASVQWPESESAYVTVARLKVPPQLAWSAARSAIVDERMTFSVWNGLLAHQPLGGVNRVRRQTYRSGLTFRQQHGRQPFIGYELPGN